MAQYVQTVTLYGDHMPGLRCFRTSCQGAALSRVGMVCSKCVCGSHTHSNIYTRAHTPHVGKSLKKTSKLPCSKGSWKLHTMGFFIMQPKWARKILKRQWKFNTNKSICRQGYVHVCTYVYERPFVYN